MNSFKYVLKANEGLHARPAMMLSKFAMVINSTVIVRKGDLKANAKNMPALLALRAFKGEEVIFEVTGEIEDQDTKRLKEFCKHNL